MELHFVILVSITGVAKWLMRLLQTEDREFNSRHQLSSRFKVNAFQDNHLGNVKRAISFDLII